MAGEDFHITISGNEDTLRNLLKLDQAAADTAKKSKEGSEEGKKGYRHWVEQTERLGVSLKGVSRDIDLVGGKASATFLKAADDALGLISVIGMTATGGVASLVGAITAVTAAVGFLREQEEKETLQAAKAFRKRKEDFDLLVGSMKEARRKVTEEEVADLKDEDNAHKQTLEMMHQRELAAASDLANKRKVFEDIKSNYSLDANRKQTQDYVAAQNEMAKAQKEFNIAHAIMGNERLLGDMTRIQLGIAQEKLQRQQATEAFEKLTDKRVKAEEDSNKKRIADAERAEQAITDLTLERVTERNRAVITNRDKVDAATAKAVEDELKWQEELARREAEISAEFEIEARRMQEAADKQAKLNREREAGVQVNLAYSASSMVLSNVLRPLTADVQKLLEANADQMWQAREWADNAPAYAAKAAQGVAAGLAMEAVPKAAMAAGDAAMAFGKWAFTDFTDAGAGAAFIADLEAAHIYATIGGVGAIGALGFMAARGKSGIVSQLTGGRYDLLTPEERKKNEEFGGGGSRDSGYDVGSGGRSRSGGVGGGPTVVNYTVINQAGYVNAANDQALVTVMVDGNALVQRDGFARRASR